MRRLVVPLLALGGLACGPASVPVDAAVPSDAAVIMPDELRVHLVGWAGTGSAGPDLGGFEVVVDQADGTRVTATTGADGRATVSGLAWSGPVTLTFWGPGRAITSIVDVERSTLESWLVDGQLTEVMMPLAYPETRGAVRNMADESNAMVVGALHGGQSFASGPSYALQVLGGHPLVLVAAEVVPAPVGSASEPQIVGWAVTTGPAPSDGAGLEIDMRADAVVGHPYMGSYPIPEALRGLGDREIYVWVDGALAGMPIEDGWSAGGAQADYVGEYVEVSTDADAEVRSLYGVSGPSGEFSTVLVPGYPTDGPQDIVLPEIPRLVPRSPELPERSIRDAIEIEASQPRMFVVGKIIDDHAIPHWIAYSTELAGTSLRLPQLPDAALAQLNEAVGASLQVYVCEADLRARWRLCDRSAGFAPVAIDTAP